MSQRVPVAQDVILPDIQGHSGGNGHQHHGRQDTDVGQPHRVLLHSIEHARHGDEVPRLIVKTLFALQGLEQRDAPGGEETVGADDDQDHRHKEQQQRVQRGFNGQRDKIPAAQGQQPDDQQGPLNTGFLLTLLAAAQQIDGVGQVNLPQIGQQGQREHGGEQRRRHEQGCPASPYRRWVW